jgi:hypothetical protein
MALSWGAIPSSAVPSSAVPSSAVPSSAVPSSAVPSSAVDRPTLRALTEATPKLAEGDPQARPLITDNVGPAIIAA